MCAAFRVAETIAVAGGFQNVAAVSQSVESRSRQTFAAENLGPVLEWKVGRHDQTVAFVRRADHVEEQFRPRPSAQDPLGALSKPVTSTESFRL